MVAAVNNKQELILPPKKISIEKFQQWATTNLRSSDAVVLEATGNAWQFYDMLAPLVAQVTVANPYNIKLITQARVKTDAKDAVHLAKVLAAGMVEPVWVPPPAVRDLRALVAHRERLICQRTRTRNRLHAILQAHHLFPPEGEPFAAKNKAWWEKLDLSFTQKLLIKQEMQILAGLEPLIQQVEQELLQLSTDPLWQKPATLLIQLPGIAVLSAMIILSAIGDISRFENAKKLVGYSGLGASVFATGQVYRTGGITKQGRVELRTVLVEVAWAAVSKPGHWQTVFEKLSARVGKGKAIVAIARKLLVVVWHVLTKEVADQKADEIRVARKLLKWGYELRKQGRRGLGGAAFVRQQLTLLKIGEKLETVKWSGGTLVLPSPLVKEMVRSTPDG
jgi:transposase